MVRGSIRSGGDLTVRTSALYIRLDTLSNSPVRATQALPLKINTMQETTNIELMST